MENKNKYYTPTLDEFHVGFEFQEGDGYSPPEKWTNETSGVTDDLDVNIYDDLIREGQIRVKHLDREDIESFGFDHDTTQDGVSSFFKGNQFDENNWYLGLENDIVEIYDANKKSDNSFYGTIKNVSELKKILKMIGVME